MITHLSQSVGDDAETFSAADADHDVCENRMDSKSMAASKSLAASKSMVSELVHLLRLLSDDTRLWILHYLSRAGELHVRALCERLGQSQPAVSHHLALLRVAGLIQLRREGKHNYYRLAPDRFDEMLHSFFSFFPANDEGQIVFNGQALSYGPMEVAAT